MPSFATQAMPNTAFCQRSCSSTSATERLNFSLRRSFRLCKTCRLSFSDWLSGMNSSTVHTPTIMPTVHDRQRSELGSDFIDRIRFDNVAGFHVIEVLNAQPAFIALLHFLNVVFKSA